MLDCFEGTYLVESAVRILFKITYCLSMNSNEYIYDFIGTPQKFDWYSVLITPYRSSM